MSFYGCLQLDEDVRVLLQRFDAETADETENQSMCYHIFAHGLSQICYQGLIPQSWDYLDM